MNSYPLFICVPQVSSIPFLIFSKMHVCVCVFPLLFKKEGGLLHKSQAYPILLYMKLGLQTDAHVYVFMYGIRSKHTCDLL